MDGLFVVRTRQGDKSAANEAQVLEWLYAGLCHPGDYVYSHENSRWILVCELPSIAPLFANRPDLKLEKNVIYVFTPGSRPQQTGPFSVSTIRHRIANGILAPNSWIFIEGDTEWRQVKQVKALKEAIPEAPKTAPTPPAASTSTTSDADVTTLPTAPAPADSVGFELDDAKTLPEKKIGPATNPFGSVRVEQEKERSVTIDMNAMAIESLQPSAPVAPPTLSDTGSIKVASLDEPAPAVENKGADTGVNYEEATKAFSALGLNLQDTEAPPPPPSLPPNPAASKPGLPPNAPPSPPMAAAPSAVPPAAAATTQPPPVAGVDGDAFDGVTAEIPTDPIWLVKTGTSENAMGPFRFLEIMKFLEDGKLNKNDKISRAGTNRFCKILQQYEFNVKYTLENVVENGVEKQKIFIRRRHPRVPYMASVQIQRHGQTTLANCVNISAGGILVEAPKANFALGDTLSIKILPGLIHSTINCDVMVIGKVPKIPPGYALKFKDLKQQDKEAIDFFVQEALKKEQQRAI